MSIEKFVTQALNSDLVKNTEAWNLEKVFELCFEVAVNVGKTSGLKQEKIDLLVSVVKKIVEELKAKNVSLSALKTSTGSWEAVSEVVEILVPVVFSRLPVMEMPRSFLTLFSCMSASCVKVDSQVVADPVVPDAEVKADAVAVAVAVAVPEVKAETV